MHFIYLFILSRCEYKFGVVFDIIQFSNATLFVIIDLQKEARVTYAYVHHFRKIRNGMFTRLRHITARHIRSLKPVVLSL